MHALNVWVSFSEPGQGVFPGAFNLPGVSEVNWLFSCQVKRECDHRS